MWKIIINNSNIVRVSLWWYSQVSPNLELSQIESHPLSVLTALMCTIWQTDEHTDDQCENRIHCHYPVAGYKKKNIPKIRLYNFGPLKPHFYIVKLGFTGVYIIFLISAQNIDCGYSLEPPRRGGSNEYPQSMFLSRNVKKKIKSFYLKIFTFWRWNFEYIWIGVFS